MRNDPIMKMLATEVIGDRRPVRGSASWRRQIPAAAKAASCTLRNGTTEVMPSRIARLRREHRVELLVSIAWIIERAVVF